MLISIPAWVFTEIDFTRQSTLRGFSIVDRTDPVVKGTFMAKLIVFSTCCLLGSLFSGAVLAGPVTWDFTGEKKLLETN